VDRGTISRQWGREAAAIVRYKTGMVLRGFAMKKLSACLLLLVALALPVAARAQMLGDARVAFSADRTLTIDDRTYSGKLYSKPGFQRHEQDLGGMNQVILLRRDDSHGWLVLPSARSYVEFFFRQATAELSDPGLEKTPVGKETIAGQKTTKYRIEHTARDGTAVDGYIWTTDQGILVKAEGEYTPAKGGKPTSVRLLLSNIRVAPQDQALFEPPQNFVKLPSGALQPLLGGRG
jgi:hypothetical protein